MTLVHSSKDLMRMVTRLKSPTSGLQKVFLGKSRDKMSATKFSLVVELKIQLAVNHLQSLQDSGLVMTQS